MECIESQCVVGCVGRPEDAVWSEVIDAGIIKLESEYELNGTPSSKEQQGHAIEMATTVEEVCVTGLLVAFSGAHYLAILLVRPSCASAVLLH